MKRLGIDIGGSTIKAIVFDRKKIIRSCVYPTPKRRVDFEKMLKRAVSENFYDDLVGIGADIAGILDLKRGAVLHSPNLPALDGFGLAAFMRRFHKNVRIDNDAKCIARAELAMGALRGSANAVLLAIGTGIGGAVIVGGDIYYGRGSAGEFGFEIIDDGKTFEQLASGKTIKHHGAAENRRVAKYLGAMLANIVNTLAPEKIVLSGGLADNHIKEFLPAAKKIMAQNVLDPRLRKTPVVGGTLGEFSGAIGAALLL